jgi:hypothetical protein
LIDSSGVGGGTSSSSTIVPMPCASAIVALEAFDRFTWKVSSPSTSVSPTTATGIVCVVTPGAKVSVPLALV